MNALEGVEVWFHTFLTPALDGGEWPALCPSNLLSQNVLVLRNVSVYCGRYFFMNVFKHKKIIVECVC